LFGLFLRLKGKLKRVGKCPRVWSKREEPTTGFPLWWREVRVLATVPQHWLDQAVGRRDPVTWPPSFSFYQSIIIKETPKELTEERKKKRIRLNLTFPVCAGDCCRAIKKSLVWLSALTKDLSFLSFKPSGWFSNPIDVRCPK
jgi:hypothetical protein